MVAGVFRRTWNVGQLMDFWRTVSELNFDDIDREAQKVVSIAVLGDFDLRERVIAELERDAAFGGGSIILHSLDPDRAGSDDVKYCHLLLFVAEPDAPRPMLGEWSRLARRDAPKLLLLTPRPGQGLPLEELGPGFWGDVVVLPSLERREIEQRLGPAVIRLAPASALSLARHLPVFRPAVSRWITEGAAKVNLEFAVASNLPALVPLLGNLMSASVDLLVLTKNQVFMVYRLGLIHGRDTSNKMRVFAEIAPVVGAAFAWRTLARELAALLPGMIGAVPKVAIAYAGTYVVGRMAEYYYRIGHAPSTGETNVWYREALTTIRNLLPFPSAKRVPETPPTILLPAQPEQLPPAANGST